MSAYQSNGAGGIVNFHNVEPCSRGKPEHFGERDLGTEKKVR